MAPASRVPIIYVRGYAGSTAGIDKAVTDPFYGFNQGSTHIRIGPDDKPCFYEFESPLLRLHLDEGYRILVDGGQELYLSTHDTIPPDRIWIHPFYDTSATTWGGRPQDFRVFRRTRARPRCDMATQGVRIGFYRHAGNRRKEH